MKPSGIFGFALVVALIVPLAAGCGAEAGSQVKPTVQRGEPTQAAAASTPTPELSITEEAAYPLAEPGPYPVGIKRLVSFSDESRNGREVSLTIWYPAVKPQDSDSSSPTPDAPADTSGAPYPLILCSSKVGFIFARILASYGFVVVGINGIDVYPYWDQNLVDQPLDILFALDQVRVNPPQGMESLIDCEHVGAMGYSFDGYNALALSGARIDPEYFLSDCSAPPLDEPHLLAWSRSYQCPLSDTWDVFAENAGPALTASEDGLWQPMTDPGILAVMPMAPEGLRLFGERGLAAADRAVLIIASEKDELYLEDVLIYESLGTSDKAMITFANQNHMMVYDSLMTARMAHFAVAFFGYQLQGRQDLAYYYSPEYVNQQPGLVWGPYPSE